VFRINYDDAHSWVVEQALSGKLRQGWGKKGFSLIDSNRNVIGFIQWKKAYKSVWDESDESIRRRYDILVKMLEIKKGDIIIIPKFGDSKTFAICECKSGYSFDNSETFWDDFKHVIEVEKLRKYHYHSWEEATRISSRFIAYQKAINQVRQLKLIETINNLLKRPETTTKKDLIEIVSELRRNAILPIASNLLDLNPTYFEDLIAECLKSRGYNIVAMRKYDGEGADADIVASFQLPYFSNKIEEAPILLIQVKKKTHADYCDIDGVKQLVLSAEKYSNPFLILMNTATSITKEAIEMANNNSVRILNGESVVDFIITSNLE